MIDNPELYYSAWLAGEERTLQRNIVLMRRYYDGDHGIKLTDRQSEYLSFNADKDRYSINFCKTVVDAVVERLIVSQFKSADPAFSDWCWQVWKYNRMDAKQREVHHAVVNETEYFIQVDLPEGAQYPTLIMHPRYVDSQFGGASAGCKAFYVNDDENQELDHISRRWIERIPDEKGITRTVNRMNVYYPNRIERYELKTSDQSGWADFDSDGLPAVIPFVDAQGRPLGIPFAHIRKPGTYELWDAIPPQDEINKSALNISAVIDSAGFPIRIAKNFMPTSDGKPPESDGSNYMKIFPGVWLGPIPSDGGVDVLPPADLTPVLEGFETWIRTLARITDTPLSRFQQSGQVAAEGTLKQQEEPLLAKVRAYSTLIGNGWEDVFTAARTLANARGAGLPEAALLDTIWEPFETRDELALLQQLKIKVELGVPREILWEEMGYSADDISRMKAMTAEELQNTSNLGGELLRNFESGGF